MIRGIDAILLSSQSAKNLAEFYRDKVGLKQTEEAEMGETNTFEEKVSDGSYKGDSLINDQQTMMINVISQRLDISVDKLIDKTFSGKTIKTLTKENAANIIILLNKFQSSVKEGSESVPEDIKI